MPPNITFSLFSSCLFSYRERESCFWSMSEPKKQIPSDEVTSDGILSDIAELERLPEEVYELPEGVEDNRFPSLGEQVEE
ncbi:unnamed protein product, partial [Prunus brigantina]